MVNVAILGTGTVGQHLARGFIGLGHEVVVGTRDPGGESARKALAALGPGPRVATFAEAAGAAELAVLATSWSGTENAISLVGAANLAGKILIDATNPLDFSAGPALALGYSTSGAERIQGWLPQARVVKAFNTVAASLMVDPRVPGGPPSMFIAGDDPDAKRQVESILGQFGWESIDIGGIEGARLLEPLAMLYIRYALRHGNWGVAFKLLGARRQDARQHGGTFEGTLFPRLLELSCHQVLAAAGDPRAAEWLDIAYGALQATAQTIRDAELREAFLNRIPHHRAIVSAAAQRASSLATGGI